MRIAFVGKGGSGKTTLSSLFVQWLADAAQPVLAIDADINQHLGAALGFDQQLLAAQPALGNESRILKDYLRGTNPRIASADAMIKTTPPGTGSRLIRLGEAATVLDHFALQHGCLRHLATGPFTDEDLGHRCYHSKTGSVELLLNHLIDGRGEYVVVDMTAGVDAFASGLFTRFDLTVLVVEPTLRSLSVVRQYQHYAREFGIQLVAIGNKVTDEADERFLRDELGELLLGIFPQSAFVRSLERGELQPIGQLESKSVGTLATLKEYVDAIERDWQRSYDLAVEFHRKNALGWANAAAGADLTQHIDPHFNIVDAVTMPA